MDNQESPVPKITPASVYKWEAFHQDHSLKCQFEFDQETQTEIENRSDTIQFDSLIEMRVVPKDNPNLATFMYAPNQDTFFRAGSPIDVYFSGIKPDTAVPIYCRDVTITMGSVVNSETMNREVQVAHTTVLQCIGWCEGGIEHISNPEAKKRIIAIDERGNWRPWRYTE